MTGFTILLLFNFIGYLLHDYAHVPLPANVIALILFVASLFLKIVKVEWVENASQFLLKHMAVLFVPAFIGIIKIYPLLQQNAWTIIVSLIGSTFVVMLVTGKTTTLLAEAKGGEKHVHTR